ncbi:MAG TPA: NAD(P)H-quinone oxidoreductase [Stellaceae bacterium]|nr:NAD(P)H-quinone oxidoreductase [Stellaceae bacterium]
MKGNVIPTTVIPGEMRFIELRGAGGPEVLAVAKGPVPKPGPGEVLIEVAAAGLNRSDLAQRQGRYQPPPGGSPVLGLEVSGRVASLGPNTRGFKKGDAVCALVSGGGYAEYCTAPAGQCLPVPAGVGLVEAAALPEAAFTVWLNLFERGRLKAGESVLIHGGASGIGTMAIALAAAFGARVFATAGSSDKCEACKKLGAAAALNYRAGDFVEAVKNLTAGKGVDVVLDMVGGDYLPKNVEILAVEGRLVQIAFQRDSEIRFNFLPLVAKRLTFTGSTLRPKSAAEKAAIAAALKQKVWPLFAAGKVKPVVFAAYPLADAEAAHRAFETGQHIGKIVLTAASAPEAAAAAELQRPAAIETATAELLARRQPPSPDSGSG